MLKKILKKINRNLLLLRDKQKIKRQKKRSSYVNNYKLSLIIKYAQGNFNSSTNFNKSKRNNRNKQSSININVKDYKKD